MQRLGELATRYARPAGADAAALVAALRAHPGVRDVIVTEAHVAVVHAPGGPPAGVTELLAGRHLPATAPAREQVLRVRYDGVDLDEAATRLGLTPAALIARHQATPYRVQLVGFLPGFAYLGPLAPELVLPRRDSPRTRVPAGAVAIAGPYTGVYPVSSPGGWWLIGSAVGFVALGADGPTLRLGDRVRCEAVP